MDKLSGILQKFGQIREKHENKVGEKRQRPDDHHDNEPVKPTQEGLVPLPQPQKTYVKSTYKGLQWSVEPQYIDTNYKCKFEDLGVSSQLCTTLNQLGYDQAFAVQTGVIPVVLAAQRSKSPLPPVDVLVNSYTGSGKTLAYCVPIVDVLSTRKIRRPRALIIVPTRPLLTQVVKTLEDLSKDTPLHIMSLRSDRSLAKESKMLQEFQPDIVAATPGRLTDHLKTYNFLQGLEFIVIDEADRLVGQMFQDWAQVIATNVPKLDHPITLTQKWMRPPQRLIFSATLTRDAGKLDALGVQHAPSEPKIFIVGQEAESHEFTLPTGLEETLVRVKTTGDKPLALVDELVKQNILNKCIIFVRSNEAAARLARLVSLIFSHVYNRIVVCERCSGELAAVDRKRALRNFDAGETNILICTDLIARGIDVKGVDCVVNYDLPIGAREYVHRVGRTARAGTKGKAWTLCVSSAERKYFWSSIQNELFRRGDIQVVEAAPEPTASYEEALRMLEQEVVGK